MMSARSRTISITVFLLFATAASADLSLRLESAAAVVNGATAGQQILVYSLAHEQENAESVISRREELLNADAFGAATWPLPSGLSSRSLVLAVDLQTGAVAVATPQGFPLRRIDAPAELVKRKDVMDALELPFFYAEVLFVRPGTGSWAQSASRGGTKDLKSKAQVLTVDPRAFRKIKGNEPGPNKLKHDDVIIVIDPYALSFFSVRWKQ